jgi:hypothetical protein
MWHALTLAAVLAAPGDAPLRDCALGFFAWCVVESEEAPSPKQERLRLEVFAGYKPAYPYYQVDQRACAEAGCRARLDGALVSLDALVRLWGNPRSDDFFDLGLSYSVTPIARLRQNPGFQGELGPVAAGDGSLDYATLRLTLRRPSLFYVVKSKYLVSSFGVGVALPIGEGAGRTFSGADGPKFTLGGRLGVQVPLDPGFSVGLATSYGVVWYGPRFEHVAYVGGYGLNLQWLL